jgi:hypothetical protein
MTLLVRLEEESEVPTKLYAKGPRASNRRPLVCSFVGIFQELYPFAAYPPPPASRLRFRVCRYGIRTDFSISCT